MYLVDVSEKCRKRVDMAYERRGKDRTVTTIGIPSFSRGFPTMTWRRSGMPSTENWASTDGGNGLTVIIVSLLKEMGHDSSYYSFVSSLDMHHLRFLREWMTDLRSISMIFSTSINIWIVKFCTKHYTKIIKKNNTWDKNQWT